MLRSLHARMEALTVTLLLSAASIAQMPDWQKAAGGHQSFEVASVRPSPPGTAPKGFGLLNPFLDGAPGTSLFSFSLRVSDYVGFAYRINDPSQLRPVYEQMPRWTQTDLYDIEARSESKPTRDQLRLMLREVLEDRFKFKIHTEPRQQPIYDLVFDPTSKGKPGPQLRPHPADSPCQERPINSPGGIGSAAPPPYCGTDVYRIEGRFHLRMIDVTMEQAALTLSGAAGFLGGMENRPIQDHTGLHGRFDLDLEFVPQRPPDAPATPDSEVSGVPFPDALKNQLGLRLTRQTGTVGRLPRRSRRKALRQLAPPPSKGKPVCPIFAKASPSRRWACRRSSPREHHPLQQPEPKQTTFRRHPSPPRNVRIHHTLSHNLPSKTFMVKHWVFRAPLHLTPVEVHT